MPGTALLIALLGGVANYAWGDRATTPAVLVRDSRHEPLFGPWVLSAVETIDPALVAGLAVLIWDYEDEALQRELLHHAGLMIAAASDETIAALDAWRAQAAPHLRFHRHGHKVSFAVAQTAAGASTLGMEQLARLAALDSAMWDQNGCLSARVHFVAGDAGGYGEALVAQFRALSTALPRGRTPLRFTHRAFDSYKALETSGQVHVLTGYDDDHAVIVDRRPWAGESIHHAANACQGRVVVVRPVEDIMEVPPILRNLRSANLQSVSLALAQDRVLPFAEAVGACGVTALRSLGRAAFPQLAYSWDGLLPLDLGYLRSEGHFTTVEFDDLAAELEATAALWEL